MIGCAGCTHPNQVGPVLAGGTIGGMPKYQNAMLMAVHATADRKNSFGCGKNETYIVRKVLRPARMMRVSRPDCRAYRNSARVGSARRTSAPGRQQAHLSRRCALRGAVGGLGLRYDRHGLTDPGSAWTGAVRSAIRVASAGRLR